MLQTVRDAFKVKEIRDRLLYTFICLIIIRLGSSLPTPAISQEYFKEWLADYQTSLGFLNTLTGGSFYSMSIFALNISPYITASIIMQLLTIAIPKLEEMQKDGEEGRKKINNISRYVTIGLALIESAAMAINFGNQGVLVDGMSTFAAVIIVAASLTAGSAFLMWLGERITQKGLGNGISIILLINIVANMPNDISNLIKVFVTGADSVVKGIIAAIIIVAVIVVTVVFIVILQDAQREISVQYSKKTVGNRQYGAQGSSIPLKVNTAGVIPVIFASSLMQTPIIVASFFGTYPGRDTVGQRILYLLNSGSWFNFGQEGRFDLGTFAYTLGVLIFIALLIFFAYFYTSVTFNPNEIARNLKQNGGFIPGIRPGKPTADYLSMVLNYIIFIGACGLTIVAIIPIFFSGAFGANVTFGGTSLIIVVGVILETLKQAESMMIVRHRKGFLSN